MLYPKILRDIHSFSVFAKVAEEPSFSVSNVAVKSLIMNIVHKESCLIVILGHWSCFHGLYRMKRDNSVEYVVQ